jgi:hypothetical protein
MTETQLKGEYTYIYTWLPQVIESVREKAGLDVSR